MEHEPGQVEGTPTSNGPQKPTYRAKWANSLETKAALLASTWSVGDFTVWPFLIYYNGGVAFLVPYLLFLALIGLPMMLLEVSIGQFMDRGTLQVWNMAPLFKGLGFCITVTNAHAVWLHIPSLSMVGLLGYDLVVHRPPPLTLKSDGSQQNDALGGNFTGSGAYDDYDYRPYKEPSKSHVQDMMGDRWFFAGGMAESYSEIDGGKVLMMVIGLLVVSVLSGLGRRVVGKFSMVCLIFPQVATLMLLIRVLITPGAAKGVAYLLTPSFYKLSSPGTWLSAAAIAIYGLNSGFGTLTTIGSYNQFRNNVILDCILALILKVILGLFPAVVTFGAFGVASHVMNVDINYLNSGWGSPMATVVETFLSMPAGGFWAAILMISFIFLSINSIFWSFETVVVAIHDLLPATPRFNYLRKKIVLAAILCVPLFFWGLGYCTRSTDGIYLLNMYSFSNSSFLITCFLQCIAVGWVYGPMRLQANWTAMLGRCGCPFPLVFFTVITPLTLFVMFIISCFLIQVHMHFGLAELSGLVMTLLIVVVFGIVLFATRSGSLIQKWRAVANPSGLQQHQLTPCDRRMQTTVAMETMAI